MTELLYTNLLKSVTWSPAPSIQTTPHAPSSTQTPLSWTFAARTGQHNSHMTTWSLFWTSWTHLMHGWLESSTSVSLLEPEHWHWPSEAAASSLYKQPHVASQPRLEAAQICAWCLETSKASMFDLTYPMYPLFPANFQRRTYFDSKDHHSVQICLIAALECWCVR